MLISNAYATPQKLGLQGEKQPPHPANRQKLP
jgi:hypothetical protein